MMYIFYNFFIWLYGRLIALAAVSGNEKAEHWIEGRKGLLKTIEANLKPNERRLWIHAASLGEFEQGRPIIEKIREKYPDYKIVLTFFSPSGYEIRRNYQGADYIFYLPADTIGNARAFIQLVQPEKVLFIKYEFWYNYLSVLKSRHIPVYLCSAIFRENQVFFQWYGGWYRKVLSFFDHYFVQTEASGKLLSSLGYDNVTVTGDTRFDRVYDIASQARQIPEIEAFAGNEPCLIAGSTWEPDEDLFSGYINETSIALKYIIAPHEIQPAHLERLEKSLRRNTVRFSQWKQNPKGSYDVLIIDNIGMLSSLYRYAKVAYIGGGFGRGIHNILEAATFGLPVIFGPNHQKFQEAVDLMKEGGAFPIQDSGSLHSKLNELFTHPLELQNAGSAAAGFVRKNTGATQKIIARIGL